MKHNHRSIIIKAFVHIFLVISMIVTPLRPTVQAATGAIRKDVFDVADRSLPIVEKLSELSILGWFDTLFSSWKDKVNSGINLKKPTRLDVLQEDEYFIYLPLIMNKPQETPDLVITANAESPSSRYASK